MTAKELLEPRYKVIAEFPDYHFLSLKYGKDSVMVDIFFGSDFFLESEQDLYKMVSISPNNIERRNLLMRISRNRNKFNPDKAKRETLLYKLIPYATDKDFSTALSHPETVSEIDFKLQTRFTYWIQQFEALYGDVVDFWESFDFSESEKLLLIKNILINTIQNESNNSTIKSLQGRQNPEG